MMGTTALQKRKVPLRLKMRRCCHSSSVRTSTVAPELGMMVLPPTALTRISMRPHVSTVCCTTRATSTASSALPTRAWAVPPARRIPSIIRSTAAWLRSTPTTVPPSAPIICAVARPIPLPAPEIRATLSRNRIAVFPLSYLYTVCTGLLARMFSWPQLTTPRNFSDPIKI